MKVSPRTTPLSETPDAALPETSLPTETPETPQTPPPSAEPAASQTSGFFNGFDLILAAGLLLLAVAASSFAIRNSDFWMHLGTGRLIVAGDYEFGHAPFTYVGNDRHYTNHSWLFDLGLYGLYSAEKRTVLQYWSR